ncbi:hypothetical protein K435DRAFT_836633 [Dendrothele bispora CBS 962.96]|uniref:Uncharacterized protein n=1 Tax=Dendrothele bispora (strain CBS 962.96) TaxID=1314807 RepID=A0A4S8MHB0_DENBC|nr:hypothetical protein K435DRAFT_836633 [Dendrothele bispora CBS 962.96]
MKTWFCLMLSSIVYCISFLLLAGHQGGSSPPFALCIFQAGLIYAAPPGVAASGFAFVIELYMRLSSSLTMTEMSHRKITAYGISHQPLVERIPSGMYCHVNAFVPTTVTGITVGTLMVAMLLLEGYYLWKRRSGFQSLRARGSDSLFTYKLLVRVAVFTLGGLMAILVTVLMNSETSSSGSALTLNLLAILPLVVAILFGAQTDYLKVYIFWKKKRPPPQIALQRLDPKPQIVNPELEV